MPLKKCKPSIRVSDDLLVLDLVDSETGDYITSLAFFDDCRAGISKTTDVEDRLTEGGYEIPGYILRD